MNYIISKLLEKNRGGSLCRVFFNFLELYRKTCNSCNFVRLCNLSFIYRGPSMDINVHQLNHQSGKLL